MCVVYDSAGIEPAGLLQGCALCEFFGDEAGAGEVVYVLHVRFPRSRIMAVLRRGFDSPFEGVRLVLWMALPKGCADLFLCGHGFGLFAIVHHFDAANADI